MIIDICLQLCKISTHRADVCSQVKSEQQTLFIFMIKIKIGLEIDAYSSHITGERQ